MREKTLEMKLVKEVNSMGGICPKYTSPSLAGMPDRLVLLPGGYMAFVEVKAPGGKLRPLQQARHEMLKDLGYKVYVLNDIGKIPFILNEIGGDAE